jgi:hypothetical protein
MQHIWKLDIYSKYWSGNLKILLEKYRLIREDNIKKCMLKYVRCDSGRIQRMYLKETFRQLPRIALCPFNN